MWKGVHSLGTSNSDLQWREAGVDLGEAHGALVNFYVRSSVAGPLVISLFIHGL